MCILILMDMTKNAFQNEWNNLNAKGTISIVLEEDHVPGYIKLM